MGGEPDIRRLDFLASQVYPSFDRFDRRAVFFFRSSPGIPFGNFLEIFFRDYYPDV
jgi:hypothetical protein